MFLDLYQQTRPGVSLNQRLEMIFVESTQFNEAKKNSEPVNVKITTVARGMLWGMILTETQFRRGSSCIIEFHDSKWKQSKSEKRKKKPLINIRHWHITRLRIDRGPSASRYLTSYCKQMHAMCDWVVLYLVVSLTCTEHG
jgi:hypothetical protein